MKKYVFTVAAAISLLLLVLAVAHWALVGDFVYVLADYRLSDLGHTYGRVTRFAGVEFYEGCCTFVGHPYLHVSIPGWLLVFATAILPAAWIKQKFSSA